MERIELITALAKDRAEKMTALEEVTTQLRAEITIAIQSGELTEHKVARDTGISRTTIRAWMGKGFGT